MICNIMLSVWILCGCCLGLGHCMSHFCSVQRGRSVSYHTSSTYDCIYWYKSRTCTSYSRSYRTQYYTSTKCCHGYKSAQCDVPICPGGCGTRGLCVAPSKCECPTTMQGSNCKIATCSHLTDCYPGTCTNPARGQCSCSSGYQGTNCRTIQITLTMRQCGVTVSPDGAATPFSATCGQVKYSNIKDVSRLSMKWESEYVDVTDLPPRPAYIKRFQPGIVQNYAVIIQKNKDSLKRPQDRVNCNVGESSANPKQSTSCQNILFRMQRRVHHGDSIQVKMASMSGGYKTIRNDQTFKYRNESYQGSVTESSLTVVFDHNPPIHCLRKSPACAKETSPPLELNPDVTATSSVGIYVNGWSDVDSGLSDVMSYKVFRMDVNAAGKQTIQGGAVTTGNVNLLDTSRTQVKFPAPGLYSVIVSIPDKAGNAAKVRTLVLYDTTSEIKMKASAALNFSGSAVLEDGSIWLQTAQSAEDNSAPVVLSWDGRFENSFLADNKLLNPVEPFTDGLDDDSGNLTASGWVNNAGIVMFEYRVKREVAAARGRRAADGEWAVVPPRAGTIPSHVSLNFRRRDGDVFVISVRATDAMRHSVIDECNDDKVVDIKICVKMNVRVDSTPPQIKGTPLQRNVQGLTGDHYSRVTLHAVDEVSGVSKVTFRLYDVTGGKSDLVVSQTQKLNPLCGAAVAGKCVCAPSGECLTQQQEVLVDHCLLKNSVSKKVEMELDVFNRAALKSTTKIALGSVTRHAWYGLTYAPLTDLNMTAEYGVKAVLSLTLQPSCYIVSRINLIIYDGDYTGDTPPESAQMQEVDVPPEETTVLLEGLHPWRPHTAMGVVIYEGGIRSESLQYVFSTGAVPVPDTDINLDVREVRLIDYMLSLRECTCSPGGTVDGSSTCSARGCVCRPGGGDPKLAGVTCAPYLLPALPTFGPVSGNTHVILRGGFLGPGVTKDPPHNLTYTIQANLCFINSSIIIPLRTEFANDTLVRLRSPNVSSQLGPQGGAALIELSYEGRHLVTTNFTFRPDPVIETIEPRTSILRGGVVQTVTGQHLDSVFAPILTITIVYDYEDVFEQPNNQACTVVNSTIMLCPTPAIHNCSFKFSDRIPTCSRRTRRSLSDQVQDDQEFQRQRRDLIPYYSLNDKELQFYLNFKLDGVDTYHNVSEALPEQGIVHVFRDPVIKDFEGDDRVHIFDQYKGDKHLEISVHIGTNLRYSPGYVHYAPCLTCHPSRKAAVVGATIGCVCVVLLAVGLLLWWWRRRKAAAKRPQHLLDMQYTSNPFSRNMPPSLLELFDDESLKTQIRACMLDKDSLQPWPLTKQLGKGEFGVVYEGMFNDENNHQRSVAVKSIRGWSEGLIKEALLEYSRHAREFLEEALIMKEYNHEHVLSLIGVIIDQATPYVILPLMELGDLRNFVLNPENSFTVRELVEYALQVARGMEYLAHYRFVHRDLAARNCMVNSDHVVKIADFGLARDIYERDYYHVQDKARPLPMKWMAPESLIQSKFTAATDVWSYGVVLWELMTRGVKPYPDVNNQEIKSYLMSGRRMAKPPAAPDEVYALMLACWNEDPDHRPGFSRIVTDLEALLSDDMTSSEDGSTRPPSTEGGAGRTMYENLLRYVDPQTANRHDYLSLATDDEDVGGYADLPRDVAGSRAGAGTGAGAGSGASRQPHARDTVMPPQAAGRVARGETTAPRDGYTNLGAQGHEAGAEGDAAGSAYVNISGLSPAEMAPTPSVRAKKPAPPPKPNAKLNPQAVSATPKYPNTSGNNSASSSGHPALSGARPSPSAHSHASSVTGTAHARGRPGPKPAAKPAARFHSSPTVNPNYDIPNPNPRT